MSRVDFQHVLITDDRAAVHVGRVWEWLLTRTLEANSRLIAWRRPGAASSEVTIEDLVASSSSWVAGRGACRQLVIAQRKGRSRALDADVVLSPPGFVRRAGSGASGATFSGQVVVDNVRHRPFEAFRQLLRAKDAQRFPAVWQNPRAFERAGCSGCERRFFPSDEASKRVTGKGR